MWLRICSSGTRRCVTRRRVPEERILRTYTHLLRRTAITLAQFLQGEFKLLDVTASNSCIPVQNRWGWSAIVSCTCELILLFFVVFNVARTVHKFDFRLVIHWTPNKWWPADNDKGSHRHIFGRIYMFSPHGYPPDKLPSSLLLSVRDRISPQIWM
jgi:hypothetical protein